MADSRENGILVVLIDGSNEARVSRSLFESRRFFAVQDSPSDPPTGASHALRIPSGVGSLFVVSNQSSAPLTVAVDGQLSPAQRVQPGKLALLTSDGSDVLAATPPPAARIDETGLDHNLLSGLTAGNPHPQYVTTAQLQDALSAMPMPAPAAGEAGGAYDALLLDGHAADYFLNRENHRGVIAPETIQPQGSGSTLDADTVDGYHAADFALAVDFAELKAKLQTAASWNAGFSGTFVGHPLGQHTDVDVTGAADGDRLAYRASDAKWIPMAGGGGGVSDHGALTGLLDDDHPQYSLVDGTRSYTGNVTIDNAGIDAALILVAGVGNETGQIRYLTTDNSLNLENLQNSGIVSLSAKDSGGTEYHVHLHPDHTGGHAFHPSVDGVIDLGSNGGGGFDERWRDLHISRNAFASTYTSSVATGTAPLTVASTTLVTNLNADLLDGLHAAAFSLAGHVHDHGDLTGLADDDHTQYLLVDGSRPMGGQLNMNGWFIVGGTAAGDVLALRSTTGAAGSGDAIIFQLATGEQVWFDENAQLNMNSNKIVSVADPSAPQDAATKAYVDAQTYTNEMAQDAVGNALVDSATIDFTYNDVGNTITAAVIQAGIDHGSIGGLGDDDHTIYLKADGTRALTANWDVGSFQVRAETFQSDVATGTAPLVIASTTVVTNLNADLLDGNHAAAFALASHTHAASDITSGQLALARGGTNADLSATGGASKVLMQTSVGAAITVAQLVPTDLSGWPANATGFLKNNGSGTLTWDAGTGSYTDEQAQDAVGTILTDSSTIDFTYNDAGNTITAAVIQAGIDHGSIGGLGDDDHTIYLKIDGTRAMTGTLDLASGGVRGATNSAMLFTSRDNSDGAAVGFNFVANTNLRTSGDVLFKFGDAASYFYGTWESSLSFVYNLQSPLSLPSSVARAVIKGNAQPTSLSLTDSSSGGSGDGFMFTWAGVTSDSTIKTDSLLLTMTANNDNANSFGVSLYAIGGTGAGQRGFSPVTDNVGQLGNSGARWQSLAVGTAASQFDGALTVGGSITGNNGATIGTGTLTVNDQVAIFNAGLRTVGDSNGVALWNTGSGKYTAFVPGSITTSTSYKLPQADGSAGYYLKTDGAGNLSWASVSGTTPEILTYGTNTRTGDSVASASDVKLARQSVTFTGASKTIWIWAYAYVTNSAGGARSYTVTIYRDTSVLKTFTMNAFGNHANSTSWCYTMFAADTQTTGTFEYSIQVKSSNATGTQTADSQIAVFVLN